MAACLELLLAEDNPVNQKVMRLMLMTLGHRVSMVKDGQLALDALDTGWYDAVLLDVQMSTMDGLEAARQICRRWPDGERPQLIGISAHASEQNRRDCLQAGMNDFLSKPVKIDALREALEKIEPKQLSRSPEENGLEIVEGN